MSENDHSFITVIQIIIQLKSSYGEAFIKEFSSVHCTSPQAEVNPTVSTSTQQGDANAIALVGLGSMIIDEVRFGNVPN